MNTDTQTQQTLADCRHCGRQIERIDGLWIDTKATGDDSIWRKTCDAHDAEHEPKHTHVDTIMSMVAEYDELKRHADKLAEALREVADWLSRSVRTDDQEQAADAREIISAYEEAKQ